MPKPRFENAAHHLYIVPPTYQVASYIMMVMSILCDVHVHGYKYLCKAGIDKVRLE